MSDFASSSSKTSVLTLTGAPAVASSGSAAYQVQVQAGKGIRNTALPGGLIIGNLAAGSELNIVSTDFGILRDAVEAQANTALANANLAGASVTRLAELAETKVTDGANLNQKTTQLGLVAFAVMAVVLGGLFFFFRR
jgi:hypothetical protein